MAEPRDATPELSQAIADLAGEVRELRAITAQENLELRGRIRRLEAMIERRADQQATGGAGGP